MAYNPYNAYKKIVSAKGDWHNAKSTGADPDEFYRRAMPYYQELYDNGYGELADNLTKSDYTTAKKLRDTYGLKPDEEYGLDDTLAGISGASANGTKTYTGNAVDDALLTEGLGGSDYYNRLMGQAAGIADGSTQTQPSATVQNLLDAYTGGNDRLNGEIRYDENGNVISGLNTEHYNIGRNQLDYINNFDVTAQPYFQAIMDQYKLGGQNAANAEYASGAANNGGNIDSYAAANANRQQLAFTTAGMQSALAAAQQNANNWQTLYSQMSADLANQGALNLSTLDAAKAMYATDAQERMNALDVAGSMESQRMLNAITAFQTAVEERMHDKSLTAEQAMQEKDLAAQLERLEKQLASEERMHTQDVNLGYYQTDAQKAMNAENAYTDRYLSDNSLAGTRYSADASLAGTKYQTDAQREANNLNYWLGMNGYQNALDQINAQGDVTSRLNREAADQQLAYNQWLAENGLTVDKNGNLVYGSGTGTVDDGASLNVSEANTLKFITDTMNALHSHSDPSITDLSDVYWAAVQFDQVENGGANKEFIDDYFEKKYKWRNYGNESDTSGLLAAILNGGN